MPTLLSRVEATSASAETTVPGVVVPDGAIVVIHGGWRVNAGQASVSLTFDGSSVGITKVINDLVTGDGEMTACCYVMSGRSGTGDFVFSISASTTDVVVAVEVWTEAIVIQDNQSATNSTTTPTCTVASKTGGQVSASCFYRGSDPLTPDPSHENNTSENTAGNVQGYFSTKQGSLVITVSWTGANGDAHWTVMAVSLIGQGALYNVNPLRTFRPRPYAPGSIR